MEPREVQIATGQSTEERLRTLERSNRRLKLYVVCASLLLLFGATQQNDPKTISAQQFVLQDGAGASKAVLMVANGEAQLMLGGERRVALLGPSSIDLFCSDPEKSFSATLGEPARPIPEWFDAKWREKLGIPNDAKEWPAKSPGIQLTTGDYRFGVSFLPESSSAIMLLRATKEKGACSLRIDESGPALEIADSNLKTRAIVGASLFTTAAGVEIRNPESSVLLLQPDARVLWHAP